MILTRRALSTTTIGMAMAVTLVLIPSTANATEPDSGSAALTASKGAVLNLDGASDHVADLPAVPEVETRELATIALASGLGNAGHEFDVAKATGVTTTTSIKAIRIPVIAERNRTGQSALTVFFDVNNIVVSSVEMSFEAVDATSGRVQVWNDGALRMDQVVTSQESISSPESRSAMAVYKKGDWWGNLNTCLSNAGIPGWVVAGLSLACGVACAITAGIGCGVCLAAAIGAASGTVTACVAIANKYS